MRPRKILAARAQSLSGPQYKSEPDDYNNQSRSRGAIAPPLPQEGPQGQSRHGPASRLPESFSRLGDQDHEWESCCHANDFCIRLNELGKGRLVPVIDVFRMIAKPDQIAAAHQVHHLEPRLVRDRQQQIFIGQRDQTLQRLFWLEQMLEHLQRHHGVIAFAIKLWVEQIGFLKTRVRPAAARFGQCIGAQIQAFIIGQRNITRIQHVENVALTATEIQNIGRRDLG
mmetsp:Transcript_8228/g.10723  ORF Transcript_8228/g.10723 Transcript_8228/m.10723 type:complete len:227 (+) Transcript_8228:195-875(+)